MDVLLEALVAAAKTGEFVTVAYGGGSRPGHPRRLLIVSCTHTDFRGFEEGGGTQKLYKLGKVLWLEDHFGKRINGPAAGLAAKPQLPIFDTLDDYARHLRPEFEKAGWRLHQEPHSLGVGTYFKNGKPKKTPSIAVTHFSSTGEAVGDFEQPGRVEEPVSQRGAGRPWRVDSWRFKQGRTFAKLRSAIELFVEEVRASSPDEAKGMFAGH